METDSPTLQLTDADSPPQALFAYLLSLSASVSLSTPVSGSAPRQLTHSMLLLRADAAYLQQFTKQMGVIAWESQSSLGRSVMKLDHSVVHEWFPLAHCSVSLLFFMFVQGPNEFSFGRVTLVFFDLSLPPSVNLTRTASLLSLIHI